MKLYTALLICFLIPFNLLSADLLVYKYVPGSKQKIEAAITGRQVFKDVEGTPFQSTEYMQEYKTVRTIIDIKGGNGVIEDQTYYYNKNINDQSVLKEITDSRLVTYLKDSIGRMIVKKENIFPTLRNTPQFKDSEVSVGDTWRLSGIEVQDLFNDGVVSFFPLDISYTFEGYTYRDNKKLARIRYEFQIDLTNQGHGDIDPRIQRVIGISKTVMLFDIKNGVQIEEVYERHYQFLLNSVEGSYIAEFTDQGKRIWYPVELFNKKSMIDELRDDLKKEKIEDASISEDERGIKISLENLHFYPDSSELLPREKVRLTKIADLIRKYKDRGVMVIGHTTDKGTEKGRLKLSIDRARVIVDYLIDLDAINVLKSSFGGKGGTEPKADNSTEEGMKKNRRVEIFILEE